LGPSELEAKILTLGGEYADRIGVSAQSLDGKHSIAIRADDVFPTASSIKMYVLYALLAGVDRHRVSLDERVELTADVQQPGSGVLFHLNPGLRPSLRDLAILMMMISDNSAMTLLSRYLGLDVINDEIDRLGLTETWLGDWSRFDTEYADSLSFGTGTPREFAEFLMQMWRGQLLSGVSSEVFWDVLRIQKYILPLRRRLPASPWSREFGVPESIWVASKGGLLDDCASESGLVRVHDGGWIISIMIGDMPAIEHHPEIGEDLISEISLAVYEAWVPHCPKGEKHD
jgi:beta-lactamase class A